MNTVNTVCGRILPDELGITLAHEHIVFGYPGWYADTLGTFDRKTIIDNSVGIYNNLREKYNLNTVIDATTNDCGREPEIYKEISEKTGINIICCTGLYSEAEGAAAYFKFRDTISDIVNEIYEIFMKDITEGIRKTGIKAGAIKVASSHGKITPYEMKVFQAAAKASKETGVPIITHTEGGTMGPEQADLLISEGASPNKIVIGHMCDNVDLKYQLEVLEKGVSIAFDRMGHGLAGK
jgi:phosphotriesterase-related protein